MRVVFTVESVKAKVTMELSLNERRYFEKWKILPENIHLTFQREYTVYGIQFTTEGFINFVLVDDTGSRYPKFFPSEFFFVSDNRVSKYWIGCSGARFPFATPLYPSFISFERFVNDRFFYNDLIECENGAPEIFEHFKRKMDIEFSDQKLKAAGIFEGTWLQCAYCDDIWNESSDDGIVICSKNSHWNNNPFWKERF
jgi:hypothetical protein